MSLPYWSLPSIPLVGSLEIQPFGVLVAIGVLTGIAMSWRKARSLGVDEDTHRAFAGWVIVTGFIGAHLFQVFFYEGVIAQPGRLLDDPLMLFRIWDGISSYGGIFGALVGFWYFTRSRGVSRLQWGDIAAWGVVPGWLFGRAGCAVVHDHPGVKSDFFLAIDFPPDAPYVVQTLGLEPGPRHDLGFYEFLFWIVIAIALFAATRRPRPAGFALGFVAVLYAPVRFSLEFLRLERTDPTFLGLTPAQYASVIVLVVGVALLVTAYKRRDEAHPVMPPSAQKAADKGASGAKKGEGSKPRTGGRAGDKKKGRGR